MTDPACGKCRFRNGRQDEWSGHAECRRFPPTNAPHSRGGNVSVWPTTAAYDWCGEFQSNPATTLAEGEQ